jgi:hypothetical protein|tara:strand:+ start:507 stop:1139 length:633 start_codon:yes stop_codon:yes gene_type:complete
MKEFDYKKYLAEGKLLKEDNKTFNYDKLTHKQIEKLEDLKLAKEKKSKFKKTGEEAGFDMRGLKEFVGKELEDRNEELYHLVPGAGKADTMEGEMLRAINRIVYRWYNDGDEYHTGYGTETAGPAHAFLVDANHPKKAALKQIFSTGTNYEQTIKDALDLILDYIESRNGEYTPNSLGDMFDYDAHFEDDEEEEHDYDHDDYDDEDDDWV